MKSNQNPMQDYFEYLDMLRESGSTDIVLATHFLMNAFPHLEKKEARGILITWMETFSERQEQETTQDETI